MKLGIIKERKNPPDKRVVFSPKAIKKLIQMYPNVEVFVESSPIRIYSDAAYKKLGISVVTDVSNCDVLLGVKEVPIDALIPNKNYFFFSHTIKKQPYNQQLLKAILEKNIQLFDHETITRKDGARLIGFGKYAGIVGAYNGFRAIGLHQNIFHLPKAETLENQLALIQELQKIKLPNLKIVLTGTGKVAYGAKEMLDAMQLKRVEVDAFLHQNFEQPVYCMIDVLDYNKRKDGLVKDNIDFYNHPQEYASNFMRFAKVAHFFIAGHFYGEGAPYLFTREDAKHSDFKIKYIADISCDIDGPVASTIRASTIENPIYGYHRYLEKEVDFKDENAIVVMAVDNLPCELPKDASDGFGEMFLEHVIPAFFNGDKEGVLERAKMTEHGKLTKRYQFLHDYVTN